MKTFRLTLGLVTLGFLHAQTQLGPPDVKGIGIEQRFNAAVPLDTVFRDETGASVPLRSFFGNKPVVLAPVYYTCPMLCSQILSGVVSSMRPLSLKPGRDFEVVAISFDPHDAPRTAAKERLHYSHNYSSSGSTAGWHFLVGDQPAIHSVMDAIGFHYRWDAAHSMFIHASGIMLLTPEGHVSRYLYGVEYAPKDLKLGLVESSHNRIGTAVDNVLLLCYHYDPKTGKYGATVLNLLRGAAILTLIIMAAASAFLWKRDLREHRASPEEVAQP